MTRLRLSSVIRDGWAVSMQRRGPALRPCRSGKKKGQAAPADFLDLARDMDSAHWAACSIDAEACPPAVRSHFLTRPSARMIVLPPDHTVIRESIQKHLARCADASLFAARLSQPPTAVSSWTAFRYPRRPRESRGSLRPLPSPRVPSLNCCCDGYGNRTQQKAGLHRCVVDYGL